MKTFSIIILNLLPFLNLFAQSEAFYLKFLADDKFEFQNSTIQFATQSDDKIIYLRTYCIKTNPGPVSILSGYDNYLIVSDLTGKILKQYHLAEDNMKMAQLNAVRHFDKIIVFGSVKNDLSNFIVTYTFNLDLNLIDYTKSYYKEELSTQIYFPRFFSVGESMYVALNDIVLEKGGIALRFNKNGLLTMQKIVSRLDGLGMAGITTSPKKDKIFICTNDSPVPYLISFDMDFNHLESKKMFSEPDDINYRFHLFSNFIPTDDGYIGFGRAFSQKNDSSLIGKFTSQLDTNLVPINKFYVDNTQETGYTDGAPRFTGGIFEGKDGYFTLYEILTGHKTRYSSTFIINKYDYFFETVWEKRFILDDSIKFWNYYAELTPDDRFIIAGEATDFTKAGHENDRFFGHIIGLDPKGNPSTSKTKKLSSNTMFSIIENPVKDELKIEKLTNDGKKYDIQMLDLNGRILCTAHNWTDYNLNINVSDYTPGTYIYTISEAGRLIYSGKFIKVN